MEELERRGRNIRAVVRQEFMPEDMDVLTGKQRRAVVEWCDRTRSPCLVLIAAVTI